MSNDKHLEQLANAMTQISSCVVQYGSEPHPYLRMATKEQPLNNDKSRHARLAELPPGEQYIGEQIMYASARVARAVVYLADSLANNPLEDGKPDDSEGEAT